ncbi:MAG: ThiF family adenylyltransferase [Methanosphaera sp.]|uniref:HesA/MoeB/ThiF family protein n=1 Tax=Methanosphaera sp. TaxID=2666342 RepID=UPI0025D99E94|nr:ThiF family adenylyltransferase [Methanosphaera sp.]MCI5867527.1 ThiF family adenylyltransferase [Methanosphaera sp.]MDD6533994.1 ThiF family adenylyltransferase [Methanosphaera sp.]MDY3956196.1 ThiF family adenylyltransferase [Methanosphaera sp.]
MENLYEQMIQRQTEIFTKEQQQIIKTTPVCIIGCGGLGGMVIEQLIRTGFEKLTIVDEDVFDKTNLNRQLRSNLKTINKSKSQTTKEHALNINPDAQIDAYDIHITEDNIDEIIKNSTIIIDAVDNVYTRVLISRAAEKQQKTFIHSAVESTSGQLTIFDKTTPTYEQLFKLKSQDKPLDEAKEYLLSISSKKPQVLGTTPAIFAALEVNETIKYILDLENQILAPEVMMWDIFDITSLRTIEF